MSLLYRKRHAVEEERGRHPSLSWQAYQNYFSFNGSQFLVGGSPEKAPPGLLAACGPAFALLDRRASILGEVRMTFQRLERGKPTAFFSTPELGIMETPWPGGSFRDLAAICELDAAACGSSYWVRQGNELVRLHPDWVTVAVEEVEVQGVRVGHRLIGYGVAPAGQREMVVYAPGDVAHYRPMPSPENPWRGQSWLASVASDATSDMEMTRYKSSYLRKGAMPSLAVMYDSEQITSEQVEEFAPKFASMFAGSDNAGRILHLLGGRDVKTVGATLEDLAFKAVQGAGETRLAAAAGVPAVVAGFSEGMQGSSLNAGNYVATRRLFADAKMRPLLGALCGAFSNLVNVPSGARLWYDESGASFFQEDVADEANIRAAHAQTIRTLIEAGYGPDAAVQAVTTGDYSVLIGSHSGLMSVQLQPPGAEQPAPAPEPAPEAPRALPVEAEERREVAVSEHRAEWHLHLPETFEMRQEIPAPIVNVTVEPTPVTVQVPDQPAPVVNVETVAPVVNVEAPTVNVQPPQVRVTNEVATPYVQVQMPRSRKKVRRDSAGNITEITEEPI